MQVWKIGSQKLGFFICCEIYNTIQIQFDILVVIFEL